MTAIAAERPITVANRPWEWALGVVVCAALAAFFVGYHAWWRGKPPSAVVLHEVLALGGTFCLGLAVAIGPLARLTGAAAPLCRLRRPLALAGCAALAGHVAVILVLLGGKYPMGWFIEHWVITALGIAGGGVALALAATSWPGPLRRLGAARWRDLHGWAWGIPVLALAHFVPTHAPGWQHWFATHDRPMPGGTLVAASFLALVIALRIAAHRRSRASAMRA